MLDCTGGENAETYAFNSAKAGIVSSIGVSGLAL
jgi:hypothetical protein